VHKYLPNLFVFLDKYESHVFENNNINIGVVYRNYKSINREVELVKIAQACKKKRYQLYVSNDIRLATRVRADGIYIPSFNKKNLFRNLQNKNLIVLGSAHNQKEINEKVLQNCKAIFLSPLFNVKKSRYCLNIFKFNLLTLANKSNFLDILDIILMVGMILDDEPYNLLADLNEDGSINVFDIIALVDLILNN